MVPVRNFCRSSIRHSILTNLTQVFTQRYLLLNVRAGKPVQSNETGSEGGTPL